ncbi:ComEC/Rec2 family competence protein [uncultured Paracoccus sp.]|uniref:ComEC/Rec2 family competence protein n=1 Tax=uncultured Paracoccus sp. TaxID=189685 RepID=UPI0026312741|nr:ComEC/Rec2 family competence protein [uncultured Paracoccus sp.]
MAAIDAGRVDAGRVDAGRADTGRTAGRRAAAAARARPDAVARAGLLVWAPVWLGTGIGAWFGLRTDPGPAFYTAATLLGAVAAWVAARSTRWADDGAARPDLATWLRGIGFAVALIATGTALAGLRAQRVEAPVLAWRHYGAIEGRVVEIDRSARDRMRLTLDQVVLPGTAPARTPARVRLALMDPGPLPDIGQRVMTTGHLGPPPGPAEPGGFDFRRSAFFERLGAVGYTRNPVLTIAPAPARGAMALHRLRMRASAGIAEAIGGQEGAVAAALLTGDRSRIAEVTNDIMRQSNLYHIVSISGLHMAMLAGFVYAALRLGLIGLQAGGALPLGPPMHKMAAAGALLAAGAYLWLSGGGVPTERAFIMVAVMLGAILADRRAISLRTVALAATIILVINPEGLVTPGFQMSFAATLALILVAGPWARMAPRLPWILRPVAMLVISSLVAGLATGPIAAAHFNRSAQYGLLANLLAVPVMGTLVMPAGVIAAVLAPVGLAGPALWVMGLGTRWMLAVAEWTAALGGAVVAVPSPPPGAYPLMAGGVLMAVLTLRRGAPMTVRLGGAAGTGAALLGLALWVTTPRPDVLIAPGGGAVGVLTAAGRALSKPANAFIADSWLRADGDMASAADAAARPGWSGQRRARTTRIEALGLVHLTGKAAPAAIAAACRNGVIVVSDVAAPEGQRRGDCQLFDLTRLRRSGSVAGYLSNGSLTWITAAQRAGRRPWAR